VKNANPVSSLLRALMIVTLLSLTTGCGRGDATRAPTEVKTVADFFTVSVGTKPVRMQLAIKPREMEHGLMGREDLKSDEGMLFLYEEPQRMSFWMRNTPTPLDIGEVVLLRSGAVTHGFNMSQRGIELVITGTGPGSITVATPPSANHMPPGWHLLFILDFDRVPSEGRWIRLTP